MIQECVGYGNGKIESDSYYQPKDKCTNLIKGKSFKHGMPISSSFSTNTRLLLGEARTGLDRKSQWIVQL